MPIFMLYNILATDCIAKYVLQKALFWPRFWPVFAKKQKKSVKYLERELKLATFAPANKETTTKSEFANDL